MKILKVTMNGDSVATFGRRAEAEACCGTEL